MTEEVSESGLRIGSSTFGAAVGLALIAGGLSLAVPELTTLVGTLAALAFAAWAAHARTELTRKAGRVAGVAAGLAALGLAAVLFAAAPSAVGPVRGLVLALGLLPLWVAERKRPNGASAMRESR